MSTRVRLGVDVGGTFTDFVLVDEDRGLVFTGKRLTTPDDPSRAITEGAARVAREAGAGLGGLSGVVHGTTLVANTLIERTGAKIGMILSRGFRDSPEMGREIRYDLYDLFLEAPPTLAPRHRRREVGGRIAPDGSELQPFDAEAFRAEARRLVEEEGVEAIAVCFMHAYRNGAHERAAGAILEAEHPGLPFTLSSEVAPEIREYERGSTAAANAYVQPLMQRYLARLEAELAGIGFEGALYVMLSGGGIATIREARRFPIRLVESGPAAGAMAAAYYGRLTGEPDILSFDMGGTTAKMCLIEGGRPERTHEFEVGRVRRFKKGSGLPLKVAAVDMIEIGAGGGSIAEVDRMGLLKVGPRSAGSAPGPICYGLGGAEPTVTDADLHLGYLDPAYFLGGEMALDRDAVARSIEVRLAQPLGLSTLQAAVGIHDVVNENMAAATRRYMAEKGKDPRRYSLVAFGGAGPVHAYGLAKLLKIGRVLVPFGAGVTSALGFLVAPPAIDLVRSYVARLEDIDRDHVAGLYADMEREARELLVDAGAAADEIVFTRSADMRHVGQGFEIEVPVPDGTLDAAGLDRLRASFFRTYEALFERTVTGVGIEAMTWRLAATAPAYEPSLRFDSLAAASGEPVKGERLAWFAETGMTRCTVYDRYALTPGFTLDGPAVIEERESTTVVGPDARVTVDAHLNLVIEIDEAGR